MLTFTICLLILVGGYFTYGRYIERIFGPDVKRLTPAITKADGVENIYDSVLEYCRLGTYFRGYYGG